MNLKSTTIKVSNFGIKIQWNLVYRFKVSETEKKLAKIAVIGMDSVAKDITGAVAETPIYMAPEVLRGKKYDSKADMYSMGLMFWEMSYGRMVSWDIPQHLKREEVFRRVEKGYRPEFLDKVPYEAPLPQWIQLMKECWDKDPKSRPTAKECGERIDKVESFYKVESCYYGGKKNSKILWWCCRLTCKWHDNLD